MSSSRQSPSRHAARSAPAASAPGSERRSARPHRPRPPCARTSASSSKPASPISVASKRRCGKRPGIGERRAIGSASARSSTANNTAPNASSSTSTRYHASSANGDGRRDQHAAQKRDIAARVRRYDRLFGPAVASPKVPRASALGEGFGLQSHNDDDGALPVRPTADLLLDDHRTSSNATFGTEPPTITARSLKRTCRPSGGTAPEAVTSTQLAVPTCWSGVAIVPSSASSMSRKSAITWP